MKNHAEDVSTTLSTIKDYIRWGASRFAQANVFLGHGTVTPLDEAAAIVLYTLHQPYNLVDSYLDAVLTLKERQQVISLINKRINEHKPSAYLTHEAIFAGLSFYVDERVLVPRSPIAELIVERFIPWIDESEVFNILDLCTGSACIAIACTYAFPRVHVDAVDLSEDALKVAEINLDKHQLKEQLTLYQSDLFTELPKKTYNIIISNPPYVCLDEWQQLPAEFHAEPEMGFKGGESGLDIVLKILAQACEYLSEHGILIVEVGSSAQALQDKFPNVPFYWLEFENGGDGVFLLTAELLEQYSPLFQNIDG